MESACFFPSMFYKMALAILGSLFYLADSFQTGSSSSTKTFMGILICLFNICISLTTSQILFWCFKNTYLVTICHYLVRTVVCMLLSSTIGTLYRANPLIDKILQFLLFQACLDALTRFIPWDSEDFLLVLKEVLEHLYSLIVYCQHMWIFP